MRSLLPALAAMALFGACSVKVTGAPCNDDSNCPNGQYCTDAKVCDTGTPPVHDGGTGDAGPADGGGGDAGQGDGGKADAASGDGGGDAGKTDGGTTGDGGAGDGGAGDAGPGDGGAGDGGACTNDPGCSASGSSACDPGGSNQIGICTTGGDGCLHVTGLAACPPPRTCAAGQAACACPSPGNVAGTGCSAGSAKTCSPSGGQVLACNNVGGCNVWQVDTNGDCSASGLVCSPSGGGARCQCAANTTTDFYVDPAQGNDSGSQQPNGSQTPAQCRFRSLGKGLSLIGGAGGRVVATGARLAPMWRASTAYPRDSLVTPTSNNGFYYRATTGGTSAATEPAWPSAGNVNDGSVVWAVAGTSTVQVFANESFPLAVPSNGQITTDDCLNQNGATACDPLSYLVEFTSGSAQQAVKLAASSGLSGLAIGNYNGNNAASMVTCDAGGVAVVATVLAGGPNGGGSALTNGLSIGGACNAAVAGLFSFGFSNAGVLVATSSASHNSFTYLVTGAQNQNQNNYGMLVNQGLVDLTSSVLQYDRVNGIYVNPSGPGGALNVSVTNSGVYVNAGEGIRVNDTFGVSFKVSVTSTEVAYNGLSGNPSNASPGVLVQKGNVALAGVNVHDNGGPGLRVAGGTVTADPDGSGTAPTFNLNGQSSSGSTVWSGVELIGGTFTGNAVVANQNRGYGLAAQAPTAGQTVVAVVDGLVARNNGAAGVGVGNGTTMTLDAVNASSNGAQGILLTNGNSGAGGSLTITGASSISNNGTTSVAAGIHVKVGALTFTGPGGAAVASIAGNSGAGVRIESGPVAMTNVEIRGNQVFGVEMGTDRQVSFTDCTVAQNTAPLQPAGFLVHRSGTFATATGLTLTRVAVTENAGPGVQLRGDTGNVEAVLSGCVIQGNLADGVRIESQGTTSFVDNDVLKNGVSSSGIPGLAGINFVSSSTLKTFSGNAVRGNGGHQIHFQKSQAGALNPWDVSGTCDPTLRHNSVACYSVGSYGIAFSGAAPIGTQVKANKVEWAHDPPTVGTFDMNNATQIDVSGNCAAFNGPCP